MTVLVTKSNAASSLAQFQTKRAVEIVFADDTSPTPATLTPTLLNPFFFEEHSGSIGGSPGTWLTGTKKVGFPAISGDLSVIYPVGATIADAAHKFSSWLAAEIGLNTVNVLSVELLQDAAGPLFNDEDSTTATILPRRLGCEYIRGTDKLVLTFIDNGLVAGQDATDPKLIGDLGTSTHFNTGILPPGTEVLAAIKSLTVRVLYA